MTSTKLRRNADNEPNNKSVGATSGLAFVSKGGTARRLGVPDDVSRRSLAKEEALAKSGEAL
jgi:hypothetical protein